jgi:hypothetical protein
MASSNRAAWRQVFDAAERIVTPRVEALVRTSEFSKGAAIAMQMRAAARARAARISSHVWHTLNLPAGTDIVRLRAQLSAIDRELRRLSMRLEQQPSDAPEAPQSSRPFERGDER